MNISARFQVVTSPIAPPGECKLCASITRGPFIDTGISDPWNGYVLYICFGCLRDMIEDTGINKTEVEEVEPETDSEAYVRGWQAAIFSILEDFSGLADHYRLHPVTESVDISDTDSDGPPILSPDIEGQEGSGIGPDRFVIKDGRFIEREGPDNVSDDSGDGDSEFRIRA